MIMPCLSSFFHVSLSHAISYPLHTVYVTERATMTSSLKFRIKGIKEKLRLHGDKNQHEQTDHWSNRDLIPLPPQRRTWGKEYNPEDGISIARG